MKNKHLIVIIAIVLLAVFAFFERPSITGYVSGGGTHGAGKQQGGNPNYGVIKGYTEWVIRDVDETIINTETPTSSVYVYFTPEDVTVNWTASITCSNQISGTITNTDSDDTGSACASHNYQTPSAYSCSATLTNSSAVTIYRTSTDTSEGNKGCFAAKLPAGDFDIYV